MWLSKCCYSWVMPESFCSLSQATFFNSIWFLLSSSTSFSESYSFFPNTLATFLFTPVAHLKAVCGNCSSAIYQNTNACLLRARTAALGKYPDRGIISRWNQRCRRPWTGKSIAKHPLRSLRPKDTCSSWYTRAIYIFNFRFMVYFLNIKMPVFFVLRLYWWLCYPK